MNPEQFIIIPILGILAGIVVPISVFIWQYYNQKNKREAILEIVKHLNNPSKLEELLTIFDERKKEPIDYRRSGVISIFIGAGLFIFGYYLTPILKGVGALVGLIGVGTMIAGYLYPNTVLNSTDCELVGAIDINEKNNGSNISELLKVKNCDVVVSNDFEGTLCSVSQNYRNENIKPVLVDFTHPDSVYENTR